MKRVLALSALFPLLILVVAVCAADAPAKKSPKEALKALNDLIGSWRGTGEPSGTREEKQRNFWQEKIAWEWQFKGEDVYLCAIIDKGKYFSGAELQLSPGERPLSTHREDARQGNARL